jgi:hypothetical protein
VRTLEKKRCRKTRGRTEGRKRRERAIERNMRGKRRKR